MCQSYHSVLCHELAHVEVAECGAPRILCQWFQGSFFCTAIHAKVDGKSIERAVNKRTDIHYPKPRVLSLTQPTEMGTVYSLDELKALTDSRATFAPAGSRRWLALCQRRRVPGRYAKGN